MQYILFVILSFLIGTILFYLSNNKCEPFTIGNDIQISQNLNLTESCKNCATELSEDPSNIEIKEGYIYKITTYSIFNSSLAAIRIINNGIICIEENAVLDIYKDFENNGKIYNNGYIKNYGIITNSSGANIYNYKYIKSTKDGTINNSSGGTINNNYKNSQLHICGNYKGNGKIINYGDICSKDIDSINLQKRDGISGNCNETQCE